MLEKYPERSALINLVMADAPEAERIEATRNWFGVLERFVQAIKEDERGEVRDQTDRPGV